MLGMHGRKTHTVRRPFGKGVKLHVGVTAPVGARLLPYRGRAKHQHLLVGLGKKSGCGLGVVVVEMIMGEDHHVGGHIKEFFRNGHTAPVARVDLCHRVGKVRVDHHRFAILLE